nr:hypothetical protein [Jiangella muralis]
MASDQRPGSSVRRPGHDRNVVIGTTSAHRHHERRLTQAAVALALLVPRISALMIGTAPDTTPLTFETVDHAQWDGETEGALRRHFNHPRQSAPRDREAGQCHLRGPRPLLVGTGTAYASDSKKSGPGSPT